MASQEEFNELQTETIYELQNEVKDLKENLHVKIDTIYHEMQEMKTLIQSLVPPSGLRQQHQDTHSVSSRTSSLASCQEDSQYEETGAIVNVRGTGDFPVVKKRGTTRLFTRRAEGFYKPITPAQHRQYDEYMEEMGLQDDFNDPDYYPGIRDI